MTMGRPFKYILKARALAATRRYLPRILQYALYPVTSKLPTTSTTRIPSTSTTTTYYYYYYYYVLITLSSL